MAVPSVHRPSRAVRLRRWSALVCGLGLVFGGQAIASEWRAAQPGVAEVWASTLARLDAVPLQERYWVLVLAGVLSLVFAGNRGSGRRTS